MEDDIDIYEDLPSFNIADNENHAKKNKELGERCAKLEKQVLELSAQLKSVQEVKSTLEVNLSSLLKTAKAEVARKDRMLTEMRTKFENLAFKRGEYSRTATAHRRSLPRNARDKDPKLERHNRPESPEIPETPVTPEVICLETSRHSEVEEKQITQIYQPIAAAMTVYQERLRKRILEEQESDRKRKEAARAKCNDHLIAAGKPTSVVDKEVESKNNRNDKENQSNSFKLERDVTTSKMQLSCSSSGSSVSQENCGFLRRKRATMLGHFNRKRSGDDQTDRFDVKRMRLDEGKVKYKDDSRDCKTDLVKRDGNRTDANRGDAMVFANLDQYRIPKKSKVNVKDEVAKSSSTAAKGSDGRNCKIYLDKCDGKHTDSNRGDDTVFADPTGNQIPDKGKIKVKDIVTRSRSKIAKESNCRNCRADSEKRDGKRTDSNRGDDAVSDDPDEYRVSDKGKVRVKGDVARPSGKIAKRTESQNCRVDLDKRGAKLTNANHADKILLNSLDEYEVVDEYKSSPQPSESDKKSVDKTSETHNRLTSRLMLLASGIDPGHHDSGYSDGVQCDRTNSDRRQNNRSDDKNSRSRSKSRDRDSRQNRRRRSRTRSPDRRYGDTRYSKTHGGRYRSDKDKFTARRKLRNRSGDNASDAGRVIYQLRKKLEQRLDDRDGDQKENAAKSKKGEDGKDHAGQNSVADESRSSSKEKTLSRRSDRSKSREARRNRSFERDSGVVAHSQKPSENEVIKISEEGIEKESPAAGNPGNGSLVSLEDGELLDTPGSSPLKEKKLDQDPSAELQVPSAMHRTELKERCVQIDEEISPRASIRMDNTHSDDEFLFKEKTGLPVRKLVRSRSLIDDVNTSIEERIENIEKFIKNYNLLEGPDAKQAGTNDPCAAVEDIVEANKRLDSLMRNDSISDTDVKNTTENIQNILSMESETEIHKLLVAVEDDLNNPSTEWKLVDIDEESKIPAGFLRNCKKNTEQPGAASKSLEEEKHSNAVSNKSSRQAPSLKRTIAQNKPVLNSLRRRNSIKNQITLSDSCTRTSDIPSDDLATKHDSNTTGNPCTKNPDEDVILKDVDRCRTDASDEYEIGGTDGARSENVDSMSLEDCKTLIPSPNQELRDQPEVLVDLKGENSLPNEDADGQEWKMNNLEDAAADDHAANKHETVEDSEIRNVCASETVNPESNIDVEDFKTKNTKPAKGVEGPVSDNENEDSKSENSALPETATFDKIESKTAEESNAKSAKISRVENSEAETTNKIDPDEELRLRDLDKSKTEIFIAKQAELEKEHEKKYASSPEVENPILGIIQPNAQEEKTIDPRCQVTSAASSETSILQSLLEQNPEEGSTAVNVLAKPKSGSEQTALPVEEKGSKSKAEGSGAKLKKELPKVVLTARRRRPAQLANSKANVLEAGATPDNNSERHDSKSAPINIVEGSCRAVNSAVNPDPKDTASSKIADRSSVNKKTSKSEDRGAKVKGTNCKVVLMARRRRRPVQLEDRTIAMTVVISANNVKANSSLEADAKSSSPPTSGAEKSKSSKIAPSQMKAFEKSAVGVPECLKPANSASSSDSMNGCSSERDSDSSQETWKP